MSKDILPDCRTRSGVGSIRTATGTKIPIYCANCGDPHGYVPDFLVTHVFALCNKCLDTHGPLAHHMLEPEAAFYEKLANAMNEENVFTVEEIQRKLEDPSSTFSKLKTEWDRIQLKQKVTP